MKALQIVETAYRGTLEEQDDTIIWLTHSMRDTGADLSVLLTGNAVNYVLKGQDASGLEFGRWVQTNAPNLERELENLIAKDVPVYVMRDEMDRRGLGEAFTVEGIKLLNWEDLPKLLDAHDQIWHW